MQTKTRRVLALRLASRSFLIAVALAAITCRADVAEDAAWISWKNGDVSEAAEMAEKLDAGRVRSHLLFLCSLVRGKYEAALTHYGNIPMEYDRYRELDRPVIDCYLHLGRYDDAVAFAHKRKTGHVDSLQLRADNPLKVSLDRVTVIPFLEHKLTKYFPAFDAQLEGQRVTIHIDTGSSFIAMHPDHATALGIPLIDFGQGFHAHMKVKLSLGIAREFKLGGATLQNVPVIAFSTLTEMNFGTNVLKQFHSTMDYPRRRLILSPRENSALRNEHMGMLPATRVKLPFYMWGDHYMFARGFIGDDDHLNFFMDSGLVALRKINDDPTVQAGFTSSRERYRNWGFTEPELQQGIFKSNLPIGLGPLRQDGIWFAAGPDGDLKGRQTFGGVQMHGLLAHAFVKKYAWTLDFENHAYVFSLNSEATQHKRTGADESLVRAAELKNLGAVSDATKHLAWIAWKKGNVIQAAQMAEKLDASADRSHLLFLCSLVRGHYEAALTQYGKISPSYDQYRELDRPVVDCYLHLGRNEEAAEFAEKRKLARLEALKLRARHPLKVSLDNVTTVPFAETDLTDFFPAFHAELEGQPVTIHMDTGSSFIAMNPDHAKALGIPLIDYGRGNHGPRIVPVSFGIAKIFKLGDAILENVPVVAFTTCKRMNFGTNVFQQFLSTMDYPGERLILSPRVNADLRGRHLAMLPESRVEMPFHMWGDHYMFARGSVGDDKQLNFFMDSGLVALRKINDDPTVQAGFTSSRERYLKWGIAEAAMNQGIFKPDIPVRLGPMKQTDVWFQAGPGGEMHGTQKFGGVQMHGLLGHAFVNRYAWTLDFEKHKYVFSQASAAKSTSTKSSEERIREAITRVIANEKMPGMVAAIADSNGIVASACAGVRKVGEQARMTENDLIRIGSCTKAMTSVMLATLVAEGKLTWETTLIQTFPEFKDAIHPDFHQATLRMLIDHKAGFPRDASNTSGYDELEIKAKRLAVLKESLKNPSGIKPGTHLYSNLGYVTASCMAERATGMTWESLMRQRVFQPLGMASAGFGPPGTPNTTDQPWGHQKSGGKWIPTQADSDNFHSPSGRVFCTLEDWAKFGSLQLKTDTPNILDRDALDNLISTDGHYAAGWGVGARRWANGPTLAHSGSNGRNFSTIWIAPKLNRIFVVATNCSLRVKKTHAVCDRVISELIRIDREETTKQGPTKR